MEVRKNWLWLLVGVTLFITACATGYTRVAKTPEASFGKFKVVNIPDLISGGQIPEGVKKEIPDMVAQKLIEHKLFTQVNRTDIETREPTLVLKGQILQYSPGSRGKRYVAGPLLGAGKGSIIVNVKFIDKQSGKELSDCNFEGEIKGGVFGGGFDETFQEVANEIVNFIRANL